MALTFLQLAQLMADELDYAQPTTLQGTLSTQVRRMKNHLNRAYNYVWLQLNPMNEEAESITTATTTGGVEYVDIPASLNSVSEVRYGNEPPMRILPWPEFQEKRSDYLVITQTGAPIAASIYQRRIYLYPAPDGAYELNIRGLASLTELSGDSDTPALRPDFHRVILEWALYLQMVYENNPMAQVQLGIASQAFQMARNNSRAHNEVPPQIRLDPQ
jgi:hypothetical protein